MFSQDDITVQIVTSASDLAIAYDVRRVVFVAEQGVPPRLERDGLDQSAIHALASAGSHRGVGAARLTVDGDARIGRVAVLPRWRRKGVAGLMLDTLEAEALQRGFAEVSLHSQVYISSLYEQRGYWVTGPCFVEAGIDHVPMAKKLT